VHTETEKQTGIKKETNKSVHKDTKIGIMPKESFLAKYFFLFGFSLIAKVSRAFNTHKKICSKKKNHLS
jgi:hypothetical protein